MRKIKKWLNEENIEWIVKRIENEMGSISSKGELKEWIDALEKYNEFKRKALEIGSELAKFSIHLKKYLNL